MASNLDYAWAAGFFDGEGTTSVLKAQRDKYSYIRMGISQKNIEPLEKFLKIVEKGKIYKLKTRDMYSWNCYRNEDVESVLERLWPYLSTIKKDQANKARDRITSKNKKKEEVVDHDV